jgi:transcriptional regulator with XRE-family HTH domain
MTDMRLVLASNMKLYRKNLGLSQSKLADRVNTATNYIGMIEAAKKFPSPEMMVKIAEALQIDTLELFSAKPIPLDTSIEKLRKEILSDVKKLVSERLNEFREKAGVGS